METKDIIILVAVAVFAGFRLYSKYGKKGGGGISGTKKDISESDDDYEPYSGK